MSEQQKTGAPDTTYDLVSIIYHALQGAEIYSEFVEDAVQAKDSELESFFRKVQEEERKIAKGAKDLLKKRLGREKSP